MQIANFNPRLADYNFFPRVVLRGKEYVFTIRGLGIERAFRILEAVNGRIERFKIRFFGHG